MGENIIENVIGFKKWIMDNYNKYHNPERKFAMRTDEATDEEIKEANRLCEHND